MNATHPRRRLFLCKFAASAASFAPVVVMAQSVQIIRDPVDAPKPRVQIVRNGLDTAIEEAVQRVLALTADARPAFRPDHDFGPAMARRQREDGRALALINYVYNVPRYATMGETLQYARNLAKSFDVLAENTRILNSYFEAVRARIAADELINRFDDEAMATALQRASGHVLALEDRAASGRDASAAKRFMDLVDLAHESEPLRDLMQGSRHHFNLCEALRRRLVEMDRIRQPDESDYRRYAQTTALRDVLRTDTVEQAKAVVTEVGRELQTALAGLRANAVRDAFGRMFSGGGSSAERSRDGDSSFEAARREREEDERRSAAREREREQLDRERARSLEPSPLLPPPATLN